MNVAGETRGRWVRRWGRWARCAVIAFACASVTSLSRAADTDASRKVAVGFSNLVSRVDEDEIGFAGAAYRVHILEALREAGVNAVGAESLVFNKDDAERADVVLGGIVKELRCRPWHLRLRCSVGIEWQLLDRERDEVVYRVLSRYAALDLPPDNAAVAGKTLTLGALRSLLGHERFKRLVNAERVTAPDDSSYESATFSSCNVDARELPRDFEAIANGTVIIKSGDGTGSGFVLSSDGLVLTAAHVVTSGQPVARTRAGNTLPARVVRISRKHDVALLSLGDSSAALPCLALETSAQTPGADVFAIGSPGGEVLGFSLSRGIVSGVRTLDDVQLLQTDASLSPGNSGGPLVDRSGRVLGVVSRKIAAHAVEGLGFAIPIQTALTALALEPASTTTSSLRQAAPEPAKPLPKEAANDQPDAPVSLDPEGDRERALAADYRSRLQDQKDRTPRYVVPMRWVGLGVGGVGLLGAFVTAQQNRSTMTRPEYESLRLKNDLWWAGAVVGFGVFGASYFLEPAIKPSTISRAPRWHVAAGPSNVELNVSFQ
jgi:serine protease Do